MDADLRRQLAKAISAFANGDGGVIIWGVEASRNRAQALRPITELGEFLSRIIELSSSATNPPVEGVSSRKIESNQDAGYVITSVPTSWTGPHMAKMREDRYYKRNGSSNVRMEHYDIADMLGRRQRPQLELEISATSLRSKSLRGEQSWQFLLQFSMRNEGRGPAVAPMLGLRSRDHPYLEVISLGRRGESGLKSLIPLSKEKWHLFGQDMSEVIYPGTNVLVTACRFEVPQDSSRVGDIQLDCRIAAIDLQHRARRLTIRGVEIWAAIVRLQQLGGHTNTTYIPYEFLEDLEEAELF